MECLLSWTFLILGLVNNDNNFYIISALFAIASNCKENKGDKE